MIVICVSFPVTDTQTQSWDTLGDSSHLLIFRFPLWFLASVSSQPPVCFLSLSLPGKPLPSVFSAGLTNVLGSLVSSYPVTGSFGR